jgi:hypothetical protein
MNHELKPHWFIRVLSWLDFAVEFTLAAAIFILAAFVVATFIEMHSVERFLTGLLLGGR